MTTNAQNLTAGERALLTAIINSEYHCGVERQFKVNYPVWSDMLDFPDKSHGGTMSSLCKKGFAGAQRDGNDHTCWITAEGYDAIES